MWRPRPHDPARARPRPCAFLLPVPARYGTRRIATAGTERATELSPALRGLLFINPQHPGCSPLAPARLTCAPTPKSSCRSFGERQFDSSNCVVARDAIIRLELESDTRIGFANEERRLPRRGNAFYVTLGQNARAHLPNRATIVVQASIPSTISLACASRRKYTLARMLRGPAYRDNARK